jgi:hypothetical protein
VHFLCLTVQQVILEQLTCINHQGNKELLRASLEFKVSYIASKGAEIVDHEKISEDRSSDSRLDVVGTPLPPTVQISGASYHL